jgi:membrane associated rhomboid family serine protease
MTPRVRAIIFANIAVYFLQMLSAGITSDLAFVPALILRRPWTLVTYMFAHAGLLHIGFNMLALFFFGPRVESRMGSARFTALYFISGISGALLSFALAPNSPIVGASAGVFGVMLGFAHYWPREHIYIWGILPVQARVLVIITTVFALMSGFSGSRSGVADFAHLGGYAGAFIYMLWLERSKTSFRRRVERAPKLPASLRTRRPNVDLSKVHELNRTEVNRILDKIGESGMESLTPAERMFLSNFVPPDDRVPPMS